MDVMADRYFKHRSTGKISKLPEHYAHHPVFGKNLEPVDGPEDYCAPCGQSEPDPGTGEEEELDLLLDTIENQEVGYDD